MNAASVAETRPSLALISLKNILFTTDFSSSSLSALPHAVAIARRYGSKIFITHAVQPQPYPLVSPEAIAYLDQLTRGAEKHLAELSSSAMLKDVIHEVLIRHGEVTEVLGGLIKDYGIDLVITGTHGRRGVRRFLLGSVAEEIFRTSVCPVLTVGPHVSSEVAREMTLRHVLFATDLSQGSFSAMPYALSFALEYEARLTILHALPHAPEIAADLTAKALEAEVERRLPADAKPWCEPKCTIQVGEPAHTILEVAKLLRADLIVFGVRPAATLATHRMGTVAYRVVTEAECPVLAVREEPRSGSK